MKVYVGIWFGNILKEFLDCGVYFIMLKNKKLFKNSKNGDYVLFLLCIILVYYEYLNFVSLKLVIYLNKFCSYLLFLI